MKKKVKGTVHTVTSNKKEESIEKALRKFGFRTVEDPKELDRIRREKSEVVKDVNPIIKILDKWTRESSGKRICKI